MHVINCAHSLQGGHHLDIALADAMLEEFCALHKGLCEGLKKSGRAKGQKNQLLLAKKIIPRLLLKLFKIMCLSGELF